MNKLNKKLIRLDNDSNSIVKSLRKLHDFDLDLKYWDLITLDGEELAYALSEDGYKQYEIETGKKMNIPVRIGTRRGNK